MSTDTLTATLEQSPVRRRRTSSPPRPPARRRSSASSQNSCSKTQPFAVDKCDGGSVGDDGGGRSGRGGRGGSGGGVVDGSSGDSICSLTATLSSLPHGDAAAPQMAVNESRQRRWLDRARQSLHCSWFCGGARCKHESWLAMKPSERERAAIRGLNAHWVGKNIIASQRPSTSLFAKYNLIDQFRRAHVTGVLNLQEKGEHSLCGPDGVHERSGYSYDGTHDLMPHGISYYEFPWPDMTAPQQDIVLRSVQVIDYHIKNVGENKVLVHCHAGLGRTGLLIACYYVYSKHMPSSDAIALVRGARHGAIQTSAQELFVRAFEQHLWRLAHAFCITPSTTILAASPSSSTMTLTAPLAPMTRTETTAKMTSGGSSSSSGSSISGGGGGSGGRGDRGGAVVDGSDAAVHLDVFVQRQRYVLHGEQADLYRCVPMFLHVLLCRLLNLTVYSNSNNDSIMDGQDGCTAAALRAFAALAPDYALDDATAAAVIACRDAVNCRRLRVQHMHDSAVLSYLVALWFRSLATPALPAQACEALLRAWPPRQDNNNNGSSSPSKHDKDVDTTGIAQLLRQTLSKTTRHTLGMVVCAYHLIAQRCSRDTSSGSKRGDVAWQVRRGFAHLAEALCGGRSGIVTSTTPSPSPSSVACTPTRTRRALSLSRRRRHHHHPHDDGDEGAHTTPSRCMPPPPPPSSSSSSMSLSLPLPQLCDVLLDWGASVTDLYFAFDRVPSSHRTLQRIALASTIVLRNTAVGTHAGTSVSSLLSPSSSSTAAIAASSAMMTTSSESGHSPGRAADAMASPTSDGLVAATQQASHALESRSDSDSDSSSNSSNNHGSRSSSRRSSAPTSSFADIEHSTHAWLLSTLNSRSAALLTSTPCVSPRNSTTSSA